MDYQRMLNDLKSMRKRISKTEFNHWSMWAYEAQIIMSINDFIADIQEMLACEESYQRG